MIRLGRFALITALSLVFLWAPSAMSKSDVNKTINNPKKGSPEALLVSALIAAQDTDEKKGFEAYKRLVHPERKSSAIALVQLRGYSWKRFRQQATDYILTGTKGGYVVVREEPKRRTKATKHVRLFIDPIHNKRRAYPVPIRFKRHDGRWYILSNSL